VDGERQRRGRRARQAHRQLQLLAGQGLHVDLLELRSIGGLRGCGGEGHERSCHRQPGGEQGSQDRIRRAMGFHSEAPWGAGHWFRAMPAGRSIYPPTPSGTISVKLILAAVISVILPSAWPR